MNKNKYLIAIDLDGTLLNNKSKISLSNKLFLRKLDKLGHKIILASGRPSRAVKFFRNQIGLHTPIICYNGAYCFHPEDNNFKPIIYNFPIDMVRDVYNNLKHIFTNFMCETDNKIWLVKEDKKLNDFFWNDNMVITYGDLNDTLDINPWTLIVQVKGKEDYCYVKEVIDKHEDYCVRFWTSSPYAEVFHKETSKAKCIHHIAQYYGFPKENTIAIGDANNDIEMLEECGFGIAMINGNDNVKAIADLISKRDNHHSGVKYAIKEAFKILSKKST